MVKKETNLVHVIFERPPWYSGGRLLWSTSNTIFGYLQIERVVQKFIKRSEVGFKKYGVTLKDDYQPFDTWLTHVQEELMDAVNYIEKIKHELNG